MSRGVLFALVGAVMPAAVAAWPLASAVPRLWDPCFQWGVSQPVSLSIPPDGPCRAVGATALTRGQEIARLVVVNGGILFASVLGLVGTLTSRRGLTLAAAGLMLLGVIAFMSVPWVPLVSGTLFVIAARERARPPS